MNTSDMPKSTGEETIINTTCNSHCGGCCRIRVHVKDGRITRLETDNGEEPQFRACLRGRSYRQRIYSPDRLKYPMKRVGKRGEGKFERISWDEALDTFASELTRVKETYGPQGVVCILSGGDCTWLHGEDLTAKLLTRCIGGFTATWGFQSNGCAVYAAMAMFGTPYTSNAADDLLNSRLVIMWGWNPADTVVDTNTSWYLAQVKEAGIKIVSVDPRYTNSAATFADQWVPIKPGTDTALMLAMAYVIIDENLQDQAFLDKYTTGFDTFKDYVTGKEDGIPKTPAWGEAITSVPADTIAKLAREYATTKPAALIDGIGPGRAAYGEQYHRAAITLSAMTGNIGIHGGGGGSVSRTAPAGSYNWARLGLRVGQRLKGGFNPVDQAPPRKYSLPGYEKYWKGWISSARVSRFQLADAILKGKAGGYSTDLKLLYTVNANYLTQHQNINKIAKALDKLEFIVVQEQFMTPTAKFADLLLPNCTYMERNDITVGGATPFIGLQNKVIEPLYESKSHFDIACALAERMGVTDFSDKTEEGWIREIAEDCDDIPDFETFKRESVQKVKLPEPRISFKDQIEDLENNPFPTPSGKIEIYSQQLADMNNPELPPIPKYIEAWESHNDPLTQKYPLQLISTHFKRRAHSQFDNIPWLQELIDQAVMMSTADARVRGIRNGDEVRVFNDRGEMIIPAWVTEMMMPGVVDVPEGAWHKPDDKNVDRGGCSNVLTKDVTTPGGGMPINTGLVEIEKAGGKRS